MDSSNTTSTVKKQNRRRGNGRGRGNKSRVNQGDRNQSKNGSSTISNSADQPMEEAELTQKSQLQKRPAPSKEKVVAKRAKHEAHLSSVSFDSLNVSANSKKAISTILTFEYLTIVQAQTLPFIMDGKDVLAKAKTGTGKTIGFLLPAVEQILRHKASGINERQISMVVISPTRELASQIATEAKQLTTFHDGISVAYFVGGTNIKSDYKALRGSLDILVATPGRLLDHLKNTKEFTDRLSNMQVLVLDEADQLLEQGFRIELEAIMKFFPTNRQTLLFSATVPKQLEGFIRLSLKKDHQFVNTVSDDDETNSQVKQVSIVCSLENHIHVMDQCLQNHFEKCRAASQEYKVIVFFSTARGAGYMAQLFDKAGVKVIEMHSRKSQAYRTKASAKFRDQGNIVMFSSDVSARGMDYDGVTLVLQVGLTDKEQYIHRLGRTARAGMEGQGIILLSPFETVILRQLQDLPIEAKSDSEVEAIVDIPMRAELSAALSSVPSDKNLTKSAEQSYQAFLGYYNSNGKRLKMDKPTLVKIANRYATVLGLDHQPALFTKTVGKMGLKGVPGLVTQKFVPQQRNKGKK